MRLNKRGLGKGKKRVMMFTVAIVTMIKALDLEKRATLRQELKI